MIPIVEQYLDSLKLRSLSKHTIRAYRGDLEQVFGSKSPLKLTSQELIKRLTDIDLAASSKARMLSAISSFYRWAMKQGKVTRSPADMVESINIGKHHPAYLEPDEREAFMNAVREGGNSQDRAIFAVMLGTGLRISEIIALPTDALTNGSLRVIDGKGGKDRVVPIEDNVKAEVEGYTSPDDSHLFPVSRQTVSKRLQEYAKCAGIKKHLTPHTLRHSFATEYLRQNPGDIEGLRKILGHVSLATTQRYTHLLVEDLRESMGRVRL